MRSRSTGCPPYAPARLRALAVGAFAGLAVLFSSVVLTTVAHADGTSWSPVAAAAQNSWTSVAYGDGVWIAVAEEPLSATSDLVMRSEDGGASWDPIEVVPSDDNSWSSVAFGDGVWVIVSATTGEVARSQDGGITWQIITTGAKKFWRSVAFGDGVWIVLSGKRTDAQPQVLRSVDDAENWTTLAASATKDWNAVAHGDGVWIAASVDNGTSSLMRSVDGGQTWQDVIVVGGVPSPADRWYAVAHGDGVWLAAGMDGALIRSVDEGVTWSTVDAGVPATNFWRSVAYGDGVWVAVSSTGVDRTIRSSDGGRSWQAVPAARQQQWFSVATDGDGVWVAVSYTGSDERVMRSTPAPPAPDVTPSVAPPSVSCTPDVPVAGQRLTCTITGGAPGIDILWRASYNPVIAEAGVTLDADGRATFSFGVPSTAIGQELWVELVDWTAPTPIGVVVGPVPSSVPSGGGPQPVWPLALLAAVAVTALARRVRVDG